MIADVTWAEAAQNIVVVLAVCVVAFAVIRWS